MKDFFIPNGNEEQLAARARDLGIDDFIFLYRPEDYKKNPHNNVGIIIDNPTLSNVRRAKGISNTVVILANDSLRGIIESVPGIYVYGLEMGERKDMLHYRNSGLNHILLSIAKSKNIRFIFNFSQYLTLSNAKKAIVLGRLKQNLVLFRKFKVPFFIASFANSTLNVKKDYSAIIRLLESNMVLPI